MTTNNVVNTSLAGQTGTGTFVGSNSPTLVTPVLDVATATSMAFNPTTGGIVGVTGISNAGSGFVGEFISSTILFASAISLTSTTNANVTSIVVPAGDWNIEGNIFLNCNTALSIAFLYLSLTSATRPDTSLVVGINPAATTTLFGHAVTPMRLSVSGNTTVYLVAECTFTGTCTACGGIYARRMR